MKLLVAIPPPAILSLQTLPPGFVRFGASVSAPPTPTGLVATPGDSEVVLTWDFVTGATSYNIYRDGSALTSVVGDNTITDSTVTNGVTYSYTVTARNTGGESAQSDPATATPAPQVDFVRTFSSGSAGDVVSAATLATASHGLSGTWNPSRTPLEHTILSSTSMVRASTLLVSGTSYDGTGALSIKFDLDLAIANASTPVYEYLDWDITSAETEMCLTALVKFNTTAGADVTALDVLHIDSGSFAVMQFHQDTGGGMSLNAHGQFGGPSTAGRYFAIPANTVLSVTLRKSSDSEMCELIARNNGTGDLLGCSHCQSGAGNLTGIFMGSDYLQFYGGYFEIGLTGLAVGDKAARLFAEAASNVPAPASVVASQPGNNELHIVFGDDPAQAFTWLIERNKNSAGWTTLYADFAPAALDTSLAISDTDVTDGDVVQYRVTAKINSFTSTPTLSNTITVSNASGSFLVDEGFEGTGTPAGWFGSAGVDFDYTASPIVGSQSAQLDSSGGQAAIVFPVADVGPEIWCRLQVHNDASDTTNAFKILQLQDTDGTMVAEAGRLASGALYVFDGSGLAGGTTVAALADGVNYVWLQYRPASAPGANDGIVRVWHSATSTRPANGSDNSVGGTDARPTALVAFGATIVPSGHGAWVIDDVKMSNSDF